MQALRFNAISQSFGVMGSTWGRLSFILLMLQLFGTNKPGRYALWILFAIQIIFNGIVVVCLYAQCTDIRSLWDFSFPSTCWNADVQTRLGYAHTGFNGATDLFLTCLPATMLWSLHINRNLKLGLCALLGLSLFAFVAVIMKIVKLQALSERGDYTYNTVELFVWVITEGSLVDIAASAPLIRPLFRRANIKSTKITYEMEDFNELRGSSSTKAFRNNSGNGVGKLSDRTSEESILPLQGTDGGIVKQSSFAVEYDLENGRQVGGGKYRG